MKSKISILSVALLFCSLNVAAASPESIQRHVRTAVNKGNDAYRNKDYSSAETFYREALQYDKNASTALFNLALTLLRKNGNPVSQNKKDDLTSQNEKSGSTYSDPLQLFNDVITLNRDQNQVVNSFYNLGNIYFEANDLPQSIAYYKEALRRDQNHIKARQNLRVAQLKLKQQQQDQKNNQDNNDNQNDKDNKDQQKDQDKKDQNQNQNQDQDNKKDQEKDKNDSSGQNKQNEQPKQNNGNQGVAGQRPAMTKENSDKILESAKKQEEQTRKKVEMRRGSQTTRRTTDRPW